MREIIIDQNPQDSLKAVYKLRNDLEGKFIQMGQIFAHIKQSKLYMLRGYDSFRDYVENDLNIALSLANKLIRIQNLYIQDMDQDEETLKEIGLDRLLMIAPIVAKAQSMEEQEELMALARDNLLPELKEVIKKKKEEAKQDYPDLKQVLIEQFKEKVTSWLNCSWAEALYKLGLWFSAMPIDGEILFEMKKHIKTLQMRYEEEVPNADR